jgi:hypothetical protein
VATDLRTAIATNLKKGETYQIVELPRVGSEFDGMAPSDRNRKIIAQARKEGLDVVLVGETRPRLNLGSKTGGLSIGMEGASVQLVLNYEIIDLRTLKIVAADQVVKSYKGELDQVDGEGPKAIAVIQGLIANCAREVVEELSPTRKTIDVPLASQSWGAGSTEVRAGVAFAKEENWNGALDKWSLAIRESADNHAAHYNIGVALEKNYEYGEALARYEKAASLSSEGDYTAAIERVKVLGPRYETIVANKQNAKPSDGYEVQVVASDQTPLGSRELSRPRAVPIGTTNARQNNSIVNQRQIQPKGNGLDVGTPFAPQQELTDISPTQRFPTRRFATQRTPIQRGLSSQNLPSQNPRFVAQRPNSSPSLSGRSSPLGPARPARVVNGDRQDGDPMIKVDVVSRKPALVAQQQSFQSPSQETKRKPPQTQPRPINGLPSPTESIENQGWTAR